MSVRALDELVALLPKKDRVELLASGADLEADLPLNSEVCGRLESVHLGLFVLY